MHSVTFEVMQNNGLIPKLQILVTSLAVRMTSIDSNNMELKQTNKAYGLTDRTIRTYWRIFSSKINATNGFNFLFLRLQHMLRYCYTQIRRPNNTLVYATNCSMQPALTCIIYLFANFLSSRRRRGFNKSCM